jgi:ATP-dependent RNA helicase DeaD
MLRTIENAIGCRIEPMNLPTTAEVNDRRVSLFKDQISSALSKGGLGFYRGLVDEFITDTESDPLDVAAALARLCRGDRPLLLSEPKEKKGKSREEREKKWEQQNNRSKPRGGNGDRAGERDRDRERGTDDFVRETRGNDDFQPASNGEYETFRVEVGYRDGLRPGNIVGAISHKIGLEGSDIGRIDIRDDHTMVDLPKGMPMKLLKILTRTKVCNTEMRISRPGGPAVDARRSGPSKLSSSLKGKKRKKPGVDKGKPKRNRS